MPIRWIGLWSFMLTSSRSRVVASTLLCPRHPSGQPEAVGPPILHRQQHKNRKDHHKPQQSAILRPQMHKEQERQPGLDDRHYHHPHKHLRRVNILIGNDELKPCKGQYAKVDDQVFPNSTTLMFFGGSHSDMLQPRSISVGQVQKINQGHHEHPNDIHEMPIKAKDFEVVSLVAAALIADPNNNQSDYASGDMRKVQHGDA